jgi:hypothetical protein
MGCALLLELWMNEEDAAPPEEEVASLLLDWADDEEETGAPDEELPLLLEDDEPVEDVQAAQHTSTAARRFRAEPRRALPSRARCRR